MGVAPAQQQSKASFRADGRILVDDVVDNGPLSSHLCVDDSRHSPLHLDVAENASARDEGPFVEVV
jgi:hypothetical protein